MSTEAFQYAKTPQEEERDNIDKKHRFRNYIKSLIASNPILEGIEIHKLNLSDVDFYNKFVAGDLTIEEINTQRRLLGGLEREHITKARKMQTHFQAGGIKDSLLDEEERIMYDKVAAGFLNDKQIAKIEKSLTKGTEDFSASLQLLDFMEDAIKKHAYSEYKMAS